MVLPGRRGLPPWSRLPLSSAGTRHPWSRAWPLAAPGVALREPVPLAGAGHTCSSTYPAITHACSTISLEHGYARNYALFAKQFQPWFGVRVCDVKTDGRSYNVTDGLTSLTGADQDTCAKVRLFATAYRFKKGHRIRVQVSSGAFPRYNRNSGTGEPRGSATTLLAADQTVFHDPGRPSAVILPIRQPS